MARLGFPLRNYIHQYHRQFHHRRFQHVNLRTMAPSTRKTWDAQFREDIAAQLRGLGDPMSR
jgi:hypothetical protein